MESEYDATDEVTRGDTGIRALLTILFVIVGSVLNSVIAAIVVFELVYTLITTRPPSERVRQFANRVIAYYYRIGRYITYNESVVPFPFSEFPGAPEPVGVPHEETEADLRALLREDPEHGA